MISAISAENSCECIGGLYFKRLLAVIVEHAGGDCVGIQGAAREYGLPAFAIAFIPGVTARQVLQLSQDYDRYGELYKPDVQYAKMLNREGDHRNRIISVVYDAEFEIDYSIPDSSKDYSLARSIRIDEVQNPGKPSEREYPVGKDHGYKWRVNFDSRWVERDGGVYLQVEFLARAVRFLLFSRGLLIPTCAPFRGII